MSSLFRQISEQAQQQRQTVDQSAASAVPSSMLPVVNTPADEGQQAVNANPTNRPSVSYKPTPKRANSKVAPQSGTTAPKRDTTTPTKPQLDRTKLETIISELSQLATNSNGLNVRLSAQEAQDMDDFVHGILRRRGLKGYEVSAAKLMRYAFRYLSRVHEAEFVAALEQMLKVEEKLSI